MLHYYAWDQIFHNFSSNIPLPSGLILLIMQAFQNVQQAIEAISSKILHPAEMNAQKKILAK